MTVTGNTTAVIAPTPYVPPYQYVTSTVQAPLVTGTVTGGIPTVAPGSSNGDYASAYLDAHLMSWPSYRYVYLLWMLIILFATLYTLFHHFRVSGGRVGGGYSRWSMRRRPYGRKKGGTSRPRALPSNGVIVTMLLLFAITAALGVVGADYINPNSAILNFGSSFRKRYWTSTISKSFWTSGSRFGDLSFALIPLVILLAVKSPPFAVLAYRWTAHLWSDKLALLHRFTAWLVWLVTTVHVALWTVQLFEDTGNGKIVWFLVWTNYRFLGGVVAYTAMCALMVLSMRPIRKNRYEFFYITHIVCTFLTIAAAAVHHPVIWWWMAAAMAIWAGDRIWRGFRLVHINGLWRRLPRGDLMGGRPYAPVPTEKRDMGEEYGLSDLKRSNGGGYSNDHSRRSSFFDVDKTLPRAPGQGNAGRDEFGLQPNVGFYDEGSLQPLGSYETRYNDYTRGESYPRDQYGHLDPYAAQAPASDDYYQRHDPYATPSRRPISPAGKGAKGYFAVGEPGHSGGPGQASVATLVHPSPSKSVAAPRVNIPMGYAAAQLLPSRTVRLTINLPSPIRWAPGQSVLLFLPDVSRIQSHPFTILNTSHGPSRELVLLVKARKGLTRVLYNFVRQRSLAAVGVTSTKDKRVSLATMQSGQIGTDTEPAPIFIRTWIDGPMGSAGRTRWGEYSTVLIICGGSGVSFGMAVCEYVVRRIAEERDRPSRKWRTQRVRFCWVAREYAEIAWVASQLSACRDLVAAAQLQIEIFVTNATKAPLDLSLPKPGFAQGEGMSRSASMESMASDISTASAEDHFAHNKFSMDEGEAVAGDGSSYADVIDLTNYEDEEDVFDPAEQSLSHQLQSQGKLRRAKTRRAIKGGKVSRLRGGGATGGSAPNTPHRRGQRGAQGSGHHGPYANPTAYPPGRGSTSHAYYSDAEDDAYDAYADPQPYSTPSRRQAQPPQRPDRPDSYASSSAYQDRPSASQYPAAPQGQARTSRTDRPDSYVSAGAYQDRPSSGGTNAYTTQAHPLLAAPERDKRESYRSATDSFYDRYDPFAPSAHPAFGGGVGGSVENSANPSPSASMFFDDNQSIAGESMRYLVPPSAGRGHASRPSGGSSMVLIENSHTNDDNADAALWISAADYDNMKVLSEYAKAGKPNLKEVLAEEVDQCRGSLIVAMTLNTFVRSLVSKQSPRRLRDRNGKGHIAIYSEDYDI